MRFQLIDAAKTARCVQELCKVLGVRASSYFAWKGRPTNRLQRNDLVLLVRVRCAFTR